MDFLAPLALPAAGFEVCFLLNFRSKARMGNSENNVIETFPPN
jgi:hypothetical protein